MTNKARDYVDRNLGFSASRRVTRLVASPELGLCAPTGGIGLILLIVGILVLNGRI